MSDIKLFQINGHKVPAIEGKSVAVERSLPSLIEKHLDTFLGVRLLASEHITGSAEEWASSTRSGRTSESTVTDKLTKANAEIQDRYESLKAFAEAPGDEVRVKTLKHYIAFQRIKNFAAVEIHPQDKTINVFVKADFDQVRLEEGLTCDVRKIGHFGTGGLEITIRSDEDLERAKPLIVKSCEAN